jgi:anti-anti-sigma factor
LSITTRQLADGTVEIRPRGEIDVANADELRRAVETALTTRAPEAICLDLWQVTLVDSTGLGAIVAAHRAAAAAGVRLRVANPAAIVHRQLWVAGLLERLGVADRP